MHHDFDVLERHRLLHSDDYAEIKAQVTRHLCPHRFDVLADAPVPTRLNGIFFGNAALLDLRYAAPVRIDVSDVAEHYLFRLTLAGHCEVTHGERRASLRSGRISVSSPFARSSITTDGRCRNLILRVERRALLEQWQHLAGRGLKDPLDPLIFDVGVDPSHAGARRIFETLAYLCRMHGIGRLRDGSTQCLSDFVLQLLLTELPHNHTAELTRERQTPLPRHVKIARDHIEAHLHEPIALAALCQVCGVSVRTLQNGFKRFLGQTPVGYIQERRLAAVHQALKNARAGQTVTDVLLDHGVNSFGHFTRSYRARYGCPPSQTLRHGRR